MSANPSPFSLRAVLAMVVVGFLAFIALLYFIGVGDTGGEDNNGASHAAAKGLNGYAGLVRLLEAEGFDVELSRNPAGMETFGLLVLTPPTFASAEEIGEILERRRDMGPTIVILPKWRAGEIRGRLKDTLEGKIKDGWVSLAGSTEPVWVDELPEPFAFETELEKLEENQKIGWDGFDRSGELPAHDILFAEPEGPVETLASDSSGHILAHLVLGEEDSEYFNDAHWTVFVSEPDLMNNFGMADAERAALALDIIRYVHFDDDTDITFDLTMNGLGSAQNLLTLAFRPPFLAATLSLLLALLVVGWRAFRRFGPPIAQAPATAFGKSRLVANSASLVLRARRTGLLAAPYADLAARRIARRLGLARAELAAIYDAIHRRLPGEESFTARARTLREARKPNEILNAAAHLHELERKLKP